MNDKDFKIIGQSYVWISTNGNICLDSIECLTNGISDAALKNIIHDFANILLQNNPGIKFVTVGRGGNTPTGLFDEAAIPEIIRQGHAYGDSYAQYCIARTPYTLAKKQRKALDILLQPYPQPFKSCIHYLSSYLTNTRYFIEQLKKLLQENPSFATDLTPESLKRFLKLNQSPMINDFFPVGFDELKQLNKEERIIALRNVSTAQLVWRETTPDGIARVIPYVPTNERFDVINIKLKGKTLLHKALEQHFDSGSYIKPISYLSTLVAFNLICFLNASNNESRIFGSLLIIALAIYPTEYFVLPMWSDAIFRTSFFMTILNSLPEEQRFKAVMAQDDDGKTILHHATREHCYASKNKLFSTILNSLPKAHRLEFVMVQNNDDGRTALFYTNVEYQLEILNSLPETQRLKAIMVKDEYHEAMLKFYISDDKINTFIAIFKTLPEHHRLEALLDTEFSRLKHDYQIEILKLLPGRQCDKATIEGGRLNIREEVNKTPKLGFFDDSASENALDSTTQNPRKEEGWASNVV